MSNVVKPVAWMFEFPDKRLAPKFDSVQHGGNWVPLYLATPPRAALTDEEIRDLWSWSATHEAERTATTQQHAFARAIEAAHGIGEPK